MLLALNLEINDEYPIHATLGRGGIGAAHLKVADSDLSSASPVSALLPVIDVIGQLELEIDVERGTDVDG